MVRRADFEAAGGFDASLARAEDIELAIRLAANGVEFAFLPEAVGWHYARRTYAAWQRMARQYAAADIRIAARHPDEGWLEMIDLELRDRSLPLRAARALSGLPGVERAAGAAAAGAARCVFALGRRTVSNRLLSLTYDITYAHELDRLRRAA
jgi:hypothetical protein